MDLKRTARRGESAGLKEEATEVGMPSDASHEPEAFPARDHRTWKAKEGGREGGTDGKVARKGWVDGVDDSCM